MVQFESQSHNEGARTVVYNLRKQFHSNIIGTEDIFYIDNHSENCESASFVEENCVF